MYIFNNFYLYLNGLLSYELLLESSDTIADTVNQSDNKTCECYNDAECLGWDLSIRNYGLSY